MSSLQPIQALNLDSVQQQAFVKFYNNLPEKPPTTVRIFDRNDYYSVHGIDATTASKEVFSSVSNIKQMGVEPNRLDYLVLSRGNFEILVRKLLLVKRYRVEIYVAEGSVRLCEWVLQYKGSPGCLDQLEEVLGDGLGAAEDQKSCLMAVNIRADPVTKGRLIGVACMSSCEYEFLISEFTDDDLLTQLETVTVQMAPTECIVPISDSDEYKSLKKVMERSNVTITKLKRSEYSTEGLMQDLNRLLKFKDDQQKDANAFPETRNEVAMTCLAAGIKYAGLTNDDTNFGRYRLSTIKIESYLHVDGSALSALNVFPEIGDISNAPYRSLFGLLDKCRTQHGKRLLAQWLRQPLRDINLINERLDIVQVLVNNSQLRLQLHEDHLRRIPDLQALAKKLTKKKANLQDCYRIYQAIKRLPALLQCLSESDSSTIHSVLVEPISESAQDLEKYLEMVETTVDMEAVERGDFLVKPSFDDQLQSLSEQLQQLQHSAEREFKNAAKDLGLDAGKSIKLEINAQNGYCFRVTLKEEQSLRGNKKYQIIDAVKGGVRFKTSNLENITEDYVQAKKTYESEQDKVVTEIVGIASSYSDCLFSLSHNLSRLDVLVSFAMSALSAPNAYCRPTIVESIHEFVLKNARHPCLELQEGVSYIPNDVVFYRDSCVMHIVTGANMGGKSTWMRSAGVVALLAHCGMFVSCDYAKVPRLKSICARVGASDKEQHAQSTFMREMVDTAAILKTATPDSLVLIDELGRGTSTYEGCGLAWAIAEELATKSKCFCLFATHYHELTRLPSHHPNVIVNSHAEASVHEGHLLLLHKISKGAATHSLGLKVAALADLPKSILEYAEAKQAELETNLFQDDNSESNEDTKVGQNLVLDFLKSCKETESSTTSDEEFLLKINDLKEKVRQQDNLYLKSLIV